MFDLSRNHVNMPSLLHQPCDSTDGDPSVAFFDAGSHSKGRLSAKGAAHLQRSNEANFHSDAEVLNEDLVRVQKNEEGIQMHPMTAVSRLWEGICCV